MPSMSLLTLKPGELGIIESLQESRISPKLLEMGFLPGKEIRFVRAAPGGSPLYLDLQGHFIALRREEAVAVLLKKGNP